MIYIHLVGLFSELDGIGPELLREDEDCNETVADVILSLVIRSPSVGKRRRRTANRRLSPIIRWRPSD